MLHIIRQQHLYVELNGSELDGLTLQRRLPDLCRDWLLPALERTLDRYAPQESTLCIERLEIDVGVMSLDRLEHDLAEAAAQALEKALREQQLSSEESAAAEQRSGGKPRYKTRRYSIEEAFVFFLEIGQLPWSFHLPEGRSLEQIVLDAWQEPEQSSGSQGAEQMRRVLASASVRKRLTKQFTPTLLRTLLIQLAPAGAAGMETMLQVLDSGDVPPRESKPIEQMLWESVFARAAAGQPVTAETVVCDLLLTVPAEYAAAAKGLALHWLSEAEMLSYLPAAGAEQHSNGKQGNIKTPNGERRSQVETKLPAAAQECFNKTWLSSDSAGNRPASKEQEDIQEQASGKPPPDAENVQLVQIRKSIAQEHGEALLRTVPSAALGHHLTAQHRTPAEEATEKASSDAEGAPITIIRNQSKTVQKGRAAEAFPSSPANSSRHFATRHTSPGLLAEGIYINNAGLVLLHPFLPQFFGTLGIAAEKHLLQPERALCLLHFLATGQPIAPEYELMLPKVLCNIPLDEPVESNVELTAAEQDEAVALLKAVIRHWDALRNTSPDGLRGTFFVRPGKISLRDADWLLQVEPQTWDILLNQLPWGIGMIKLPWMERMLHVEWRM